MLILCLRSTFYPLDGVTNSLMQFGFYFYFSTDTLYLILCLKY